MNWAAYGLCRDTGTQWIGNAPAHWKLRPLGFHFTERKTTVSDTDYLPLSVTMAGIVPQLETAAKTDNPENRKLVMAGDFVINSRSDRKGSAGVADRDGSVSVISTVLEPRHIEVGFVHYLLRSRAFQDEYYRFGSGIVADLWSTRYSAMKQITLAVPPADEQRSIVRFLDRETAKIDALIAKQEQLIATLREDRAATITQAVTKGLDPNVEMKDSGVDWVGSVPTAWTLGRIKHGFSVVLGKMYQGVRSSPTDVLCPHLKAGSLTVDLTVDTADPMECWFSPSELSVLSVQRGDLLVVEGGATYGRCVVVQRDLPGWGFQKSLNRIRPLDRDDIRFVSYLIQAANNCGHVSILCGKATIPHFTAEKLANLEWPHPSPEEQQRISDHLDVVCVRIDALISKAGEIITILREYRSTLITDAVTGKIDVRGAA
ncbi:restriction endonuclease subunit S [Millisia brevis]|uniref:restriction endonuclease subunit S n=1 Tax=Millisia brevis TaxID=264148 RepID=UPI000A01CD26|nr:restriction endonuclease subunit S [Millisia brevis]